MNKSRLSPLIRSVLLVPVALVIGTAAPASAEPSATFGAHVSACAHVSTGFTGHHNPSHHRGPAALHDTGDMHC